MSAKRGTFRRKFKSREIIIILHVRKMSSSLTFTHTETHSQQSSSATTTRMNTQSNCRPKRTKSPPQHYRDEDFKTSGTAKRKWFEYDAQTGQTRRSDHFGENNSTAPTPKKVKTQATIAEKLESFDKKLQILDNKTNRILACLEGICSACEKKFNRDTTEAPQVQVFNPSSLDRLDSTESHCDLTILREIYQVKNSIEVSPLKIRYNSRNRI